MDTKRNYHSELFEFISDDRVNKESVIHALSDLIAACEQHDKLLTKLSNGGCFEYTLAWIMDELTPKPDPLDESNKSPRIDSDGDKWEWSEFLGYWVMTKANKVDRPDIAAVTISPDDPGYCYYHTHSRFESVHSIDDGCGPVVFAE